jgi:hypothetical protein
MTEVELYKVSYLRTITIKRVIYRKNIRNRSQTKRKFICRKTNIYTSNALSLYKVPDNWGKKQHHFRKLFIHVRNQRPALITQGLQCDYSLTAVTKPRSLTLKNLPSGNSNQIKSKFTAAPSHAVAPQHCVCAILVQFNRHSLIDTSRQLSYS